MDRTDIFFIGALALIIFIFLTTQHHNLTEEHKEIKQLIINNFPQSSNLPPYKEG